MGSPDVAVSIPDDAGQRALAELMDALRDPLNMRDVPLASVEWLARAALPARDMVLADFVHQCVEQEFVSCYPIRQLIVSLYMDMGQRLRG